MSYGGDLERGTWVKGMKGKKNFSRGGGRAIKYNRGSQNGPIKRKRYGDQREGEVSTP